MSYDISLRDPVAGDTLELDAPHHMRGGTYAVGGTKSAHLNVTYNYAPHYRRVFSPRPAAPADSEHGAIHDGLVLGIRSIYTLTGAQSIPVLQAAIDALGTDTNADYWAPTEGNARRALVQLLALAQMRPDGIWMGD